MTVLQLDQFRVLRGEQVVIHETTLSIGPNECVGLIGPNGAGKTTLMRGALGLLPHDGRSSLAALPPKTRAKHVAWLPQQREIAWPISVERVVALGRIPHLPHGKALRPEDRTAVSESLHALNLTDFADRAATELSGGEQTRVLIARALAQQTQLLLADEPIAGLDPAHQIATMATFSKLAASGKSVIVSLHDLGLAARHCTRLLLLQEGRIVADGAPMTVLTADNMRDVFGISAHAQMTARGLVFQPMDVVS